MTKSPDAFRTISEASDELGVPQHVLRFWETKFTFIKPMKRAGGRRLYRPADMAVLRGVKTLLHDEGVTIRGVQKLYREQGMARITGAVEGGALALAAETEAPARPMAVTQDKAQLRAALAAVEAAKRRLDAALGG
ncbi:MerR family transcriptional regulator [Brevundimonas aveniformis]|uniref:MerR family transcriptional regulator n=1 Tax=Brevundimonas aveniformis TaxID=370977 RepID=UPI00249320BD|nr:MerR family transcriptional regulator [Brevundimonas aveniformis]